MDRIRSLREYVDQLKALGEIVETITQQARADGSDLIVLGRGAIHETLGRLRTHAHGIIQDSPCPVLSV